MGNHERRICDPSLAPHLPEPLLNLLHAAQAATLEKVEALRTDLGNIKSSLGSHSLAPSEAIAAVSFDEYRAALDKAAAIFAHLTTWDAIRTFPSQSIVAISAMLGIYLGRYLQIIKVALADERFFSPPLGLPQSIFTYLVIGLALLFAILVLATLLRGLYC